MAIVSYGFASAVECEGLPPNVLRFSCRRGALHQMTSKKARSRAPKAVSCKRLFGSHPF
jgi:hypothetical protein